MNDIEYQVQDTRAHQLAIAQIQEWIVGGEYERAKERADARYLDSVELEILSTNRGDVENALKHAKRAGMYSALSSVAIRFLKG